MKYRPEIDGLRTIAVLPVILFHAGFDFFSGGFVGVDVFFVISGYLITLMIYAELLEETFSVSQFYERRVRRILPAIFFVTVVCILAAWTLMLPVELTDFARTLVAVNLFSSNILFWQESGYFASANELKPMLHTWSLAVEEQFYIFFPLVLMAIYKIRLRSILGLLLVFVVASFGLSEWASKTHPVANFYLLPTRAWELGVGAILAVSIQHWKHSKGIIAQYASSLGLILILFAIFSFDKSTPFPGVWSLFPVIGTALVIVYARPETFVGRALSLKPIVSIGLISYSAYLWHQPLFAFARIRLLDGVSDEIYFGLSTLSIVLAYFTWRFVERPFRNKATFTRKSIFAGATVVSACFITFGISAQVTGGFPNRAVVKAQKMAEWAEDKPPLNKKCHARPNNFISPEKSCVYGDELSATFASLGDSHAMSISYRLAQRLNERGYALRELTYSGCSPLSAYKRSYKTEYECARYNKLAQEFIFSHKEIKTVILTARWTLNLEGKRFDNQEGGIESGEPVYALPLDKDLSFVDDPERINEVGRLFRASIQNALNSGKRVVLVYPIPEVGWDVPIYLSREIQFGKERTEPLSTSYSVFKARSKNAHEQLDLIADNPNLLRIKPEKILCDTFIPNRCAAQLDGKPLYFDDDHLNSVGAGMLSEMIFRKMEEKGWL